MYSQKIVNNLTPSFYANMSKSEKRKARLLMISEKEELWNRKPTPIKNGVSLVAKEGNKLTSGRGYIVRNYFATLVTTMYYSQWHEFVIIKNDYGHIVKMNLKNFNH